MIWTIKERTRELLATLPFKHIPQRMKIELIYFIVLWLNAFPVGVVHAYVDQKLLKSNKIKSFNQRPKHRV